MANTKDNNQDSKLNNSKKDDSKKIKVLYQYLGGQWYAFAEDDSEVYFGKVPLKASAPDANSKSAPKAETKKTKSK